jgi:hypothetical protein
MQSGFRAGHGCTSTTLKVLNDIGTLARSGGCGVRCSGSRKYVFIPKMVKPKSPDLRHRTFLQGTSYHRPKERHMKRWVNVIVRREL